MTLNQILLIGNAGRDAEMRYTPSGTPVTNFSLAVNRRYRVNDEMREDTEWFNVATWERQAEWAAESIKRGTKVFVDGRLSSREYTSGSGENRVSLDVNARRVIALTPRENAGDNSGPGYPRRDDVAAAQNGHGSGEYAPADASQQSPHNVVNDDDLENLPW